MVTPMLAQELVDVVEHFCHSYVYSVALGTPAVDPVPAELLRTVLYAGLFVDNVGVVGVPGAVPVT